MEKAFLAAWAAARETARNNGIRLRPLESGRELDSAHRCLGGHRLSDGFGDLQKKGLLKLSLEALVTEGRFTGLFSDEEVNEALTRLLEAGFYL